MTYKKIQTILKNCLIIEFDLFRNIQYFYIFILWMKLILKQQQGRPSGSSIENLDVDRDVLGSLEKLHTSMTTMGTMRSIRSNGSIPTLERVKREESNHSIGSHSQTSSGQVRTLHNFYAFLTCSWCFEFHWEMMKANCYKLQRCSTPVSFMCCKAAEAQVWQMKLIIQQSQFVC